MEQDKEVSAINAVIAALTELDNVQQSRVLKYVTERFRLNTPATITSHTQDTTSYIPELPSLQQEQSPALVDIRTFKEQKVPRSAIQMVVLVAYYLQELAPSEQRKQAVDASDIEVFFKQAGFKLPAGKNGAADALNNTKKAGYIEVVDRGTYKLNPVGYNLVAHGMPNSNNGTKRKNASKKTSPKKVSLKKKTTPKKKM